MHSLSGIQSNILHKLESGATKIKKLSAYPSEFLAVKVKEAFNFKKQEKPKKSKLGTTMFR